MQSIVVTFISSVATVKVKRTIYCQINCNCSIVYISVSHFNQDVKLIEKYIRAKRKRLVVETLVSCKSVKKYLKMAHFVAPGAKPVSTFGYNYITGI